MGLASGISLCALWCAAAAENATASTLIARAAAVAPAARAAAVGPAPAAHALALVLPLKVDGVDLQRLAIEVSDPSSPLYGHYESVAALSQRFGASPAVRRRVLAYLRTHGARGVRIDTTGLFADATLPVAAAERLFAAPLMRFEAADGARYIAPQTAVRPRIPSALKGAVTDVVGLDTEPVVDPAGVVQASSKRSATAFAAQASSELPRTGTPAGCAAGQASGGFTPNQYLTAYGFNALRALGFLGQGERVAVIGVSGVDAPDVTTFAQCFGLPAPAISTHLVGISTPPAPDEETTLDLDMLDAGAPGLSGIDVYEVSNDIASFLKSFSAPLQNPSARPQVISISVGQCEPAVGTAVNGGAVLSAAYELDEDAVSGITVLAASGDSGSTDCVSQSGVPIHQPAVAFPASSQFTLAVGGTNIALTPSNQIANEVVWNDVPAAGGAGGGGFSSAFPRGDAPWQEPFIPSSVGHLAGGRPSRAIPDVSMLADAYPGYAIYCSTSDCAQDGRPAWRPVGGTSAGTPLLASGIALVDQSLRAGGRANLGLVAPLLYRLASYSQLYRLLFRDVTVGSNDIGAYLPGGGGTPVGCCTAGRGYDEASGLGSIDMFNLAALANTWLPNVRLRVRVSLPGHQHPARSGKIAAIASCSTGCFSLQGAALVVIGHTPSFEAFSPAIYSLRSAGSKRFTIPFNRAQLRKVRAALQRRARVTAIVQFGVPQFKTKLNGVILSVSAQKRLVITS